MGQDDEKSASKLTQAFRVVRTPAGKVRTAKLEVTQADLDMYAVIVGRTPTPDEQALALAPPAETDEPDAAADTATERGRSILASRSWSPIVLCSHLRSFRSAGSLRVNGPQIATWVRQISGDARRYLHETQVRLSASPRR